MRSNIYIFNEAQNTFVRPAELLKKFPTTYSEELGIKLKKKSDREIFKWFLAAILFGARISQVIAARTYREFAKSGVLTPQKILSTGWRGLVDILDRGGYVRYDFSTADDLLAVADMLMKKYGGSLNKLHALAKNSRDLERKLQEFRGVGPTTTQIFLRELRGIWRKADPPLSPLAKVAARRLRISETAAKKSPRLEAALVHAGLLLKRFKKIPQK